MGRSATLRRRSVELRRCLPLPVERAIAVLVAAPSRIVGSEVEGFWAGADSQAFLGAQLLPGTLVTRPVAIGFGPLLEDGDASVLPVWWEDAEHPRLFPTFDGGLELRSQDGGTELCLAGSYEAPLGPLGRFADGLAGHRIVLSSLQTFLEDVAGRLATAASDQPSARGRAAEG